MIKVHVQAGIGNGFQNVIPERAASVSLANTFKMFGSFEKPIESEILG